MAPMKKKKKNSVDAKPTSKQVDSDKKLLESQKEGGNAKESTSTPVTRKPCTWLKLDRLVPQIGSKLSVQNSNEDKEAKSSAQVEANKDQKRKRAIKGEGTSKYDPISKEKPVSSQLDKKGKELDIDKKGRGLDTEMEKETKEKHAKSEKNIDGLIFMCNAKTKPDCFRYQVMGVPANKKEVVLGIKHGLKIFLYDYDLKLLYGIYEASSAGGMKLEPAAFGGGFPAQVRFTILKDCIPLPESVFRNAITDSSDKKTHKFDTQLTKKQVKNLTELFQPTPWLNSTSLDHEKQFSKCHVSSNTIPVKQPLFLTEQEYRSYGLQQSQLLLPTAEGGDASHSFEPNKFDQELKQLLMNPASVSMESSLQHREVNQHDPFFIGEKEYRIYGLRGPPKTPNAAPPATNEIARGYGKDEFNPYDETTTSLVNRYLMLPRSTMMPADPYLLSGRDNYVNDRIQTSEIRTHHGIPIPHSERPVASYRLHERSDINQGPYSLYVPPEPSGPGQQHETDLTTTAPVSHRYTFAGPSLSQHR